MKTIDQYGNEIIPGVKVIDSEGNEVHEGDIVNRGWLCLEFDDKLDEIYLDIEEPMPMTHVTYAGDGGAWQATNIVRE